MRCHDILVRSPELFGDLENVKELANPQAPDQKVWLRYWRSNPIEAWTGDGGLFRLENDHFIPRVRIPPELGATFADMTAELVDYRLAQYRSSRRRRVDASETSFEAKLFQNDKGPIIKKPKTEHWPSGETTVTLPDGSRWAFNFVKIACNVARPIGSAENRIHDLLRSWFGPSAGKPSTNHYIRFTQRNGEWSVEPVQAEGAKVIPFPSRNRIVAYPDLRAAAGAAQSGATPDALDAEEIALPHSAKDDGLFAVRASGDSMDGGDKPIRDGDWLVMKFARGASATALNNRVILVETPDAQDGFGYQLKRLVKTPTGWRLQSDNPARPSFEASEATVPIAVLAEVIPPEKLAPRVGTKLSTDAFAETFQVSREPCTGRLGGHLFIALDNRSRIGPNGTLQFPPMDRRPGETAYVLAQEGSEWVYLGVARWRDEAGAWAVS